MIFTISRTGSSNIEKMDNFRNRDAARQLIDFDGLTFDGIQPTDIDGMIEYRNQAYVIFEFKYDAAEMPLGQRLCIERMTDALAKAGKKAVAFLCSHQSRIGEDILARNAIVKRIYYKGEWYYGRGNTVLEETTNFLDFIKEENK